MLFYGKVTKFLNYTHANYHAQVGYLQIVKFKNTTLLH